MATGKGPQKKNMATEVTFFPKIPGWQGTVREERLDQAGCCGRQRRHHFHRGVDPGVLVKGFSLSYHIKEAI